MEDEFEIIRAPQPKSDGDEFEIMRGPAPPPSSVRVATDTFRPITPRRMGQFMEERVLPQFEEGQRRAEVTRAQREAEAGQELKNLDPVQRQILSGTGSAAQAATADTFAYLPAIAAKGLGKLGVSGYENYGDMPIVDVKKAAERKITGAQDLYPKTGLAGTAVGLGAGATALPAIAPGRGPMVSGALTGAAYSGLAAGAKEGDFGDAVKGALIGGIGGAVAAPLIEKTVSGLTRLFVGGRPVVNSAGQLSDEAMDVARKAGLSDEQITAIGPSLQKTFEARGLTPAAAREAQFAEFDITPKRGMVSGNQKDLVREKVYGDFAPQADQAAAAAAKTVGGNQPPLRDAVSDAIAAGKKSANVLKEQVDKAYEKATLIPGSFSREAIDGIGEKLRNEWAKDSKLLSFYSNDTVKAAVKELDSVLGAKIEVAPGVNVIHRDFNAVESGRKILNSYFGAAKTNADRAGVRKLIDDFDDHIERSINNGAFSGDPKVVDQWREARKLFSSYQNKFGVRKTGEDRGTLMKSVMEGKSADEVGNMLFNFSSTGDATLRRDAIKVFLQLRRALGPNSPELETIKKSYVQQLMTPVAKGPEMKPQDFTRTAQQINDLLKGRGSDFARRVLSNDERLMLARYAEVMGLAGRTPRNEMQRKLDLFANIAMTTAPIVGSGVSYAVGAMSPTTAGILGAGLAVPGAVKSVTSIPAVQRRLANRPPKSEPRNYEFPAVRTTLPLAATAAPTVERQSDELEAIRRSQEIAPEERAQRKSGGRVIDHEAEADKLIARAEAAKKSHQQSTVGLLHSDDTMVAKALALASKDI